MIVFDLRCGQGHVFEAWFASSGAWEAQREARAVACPLCGNDAIEKAAMAPAVPAKSNSRAPDAATAKRVLGALAAAQAKVLANSEHVGTSFASRARAMHEGIEPERPIHGQTSLAEAKSLIDDGVPVAPLPLPVVPPDQLN